MHIFFCLTEKSLIWGKFLPDSLFALPKYIISIKAIFTVKANNSCYQSWLKNVYLFLSIIRKYYISLSQLSIINIFLQEEKEFFVSVNYMANYYKQASLNLLIMLCAIFLIHFNAQSSKRIFTITYSFVFMFLTLPFISSYIILAWPLHFSRVASMPFVPLFWQL